MWATPLSDCKDAQFVRLVDDGELSIVVNIGTSEHNDCYHIRWVKFASYRNTMEEHGVPWCSEEQNLKVSGCSHLVLDSPWIADMRDGDDLLICFIQMPSIM
jgi:hypothetical protein